MKKGKKLSVQYGDETLLRISGYSEEEVLDQWVDFIANMSMVLHNEVLRSVKVIGLSNFLEAAVYMKDYSAIKAEFDNAGFKLVSE